METEHEGYGRTREEVQSYLRRLSKDLGVSITDTSYAAELESRDPLAHFRKKFHVPTVGELLGGKEAAPGTFSMKDT